LLMKVIFSIFLVAFLIPKLCLAEDFFPIGMFSVGIDGMETVKEAGFNSIHTYATDDNQLKTYIEKAERFKLKLLIYPADKAEKGFINNEKIKSFIETNKNSKSILAWYIADEPELNSGSPSQIGEINSFINKLDQTHPTAIVIHRTDRFKEYKDASDILMTDRYPVPKTPLSHIAEATQWAVEQKGAGGTVWAVLQAFGYQGPQLKGWGLREPTYDEMRAMTFLSIIHGAKGIFYYTFIGSQYRILQSPEHWNDLKKIVAELNRIYHLLLLPNDGLKIGIEIVEGPEKDEWGVTPVHLIVKHLQKDTVALGKGYYLIATNSLDKPVKASFRLSGVSASTENVINILGDGSKLNTKNRTFVDTFKAYDVHIYRVTSYK
jgi:hypothetical protein